MVIAVIKKGGDGDKKEDRYDTVDITKSFNTITDSNNSPYG